MTAMPMSDLDAVNGKVKKQKAWMANVADRLSTSKKSAVVKSESRKKKARS